MSNAHTPPPRKRGWREKIDRGLYREHTVNCPATKRAKSVGNCGCPFTTRVPTGRPSQYDWVKIEADTAQEARVLRESVEQRRYRSVVGNPMLSEYFEEWLLASPHLKKRTKDQYASHFRRLIEPTLGHIKLLDVRRDHVDRLVGELTARAEEVRVATGRRNPSWVETRFMPLRSLLKYAKQCGHIRDNPVDGLRLPECPPLRPGEEREGHRTLTPLQIRALHQEAAQIPNEIDRLQRLAIIYLGVHLGLRVGEMRGLRFSDIDLSEGRVKVERQVEAEGAIVTPKTGRRAIYATKRLLGILQALYEAHIKAGNLQPGADGWVLGRRAETPRTKPWVNEALKELQEKAGVLNDRGEPVVTTHGLRHTCASEALRAGVPLITVSAHLGHSSVRTTSDTYAHLIEPGKQLKLMSEFFDEHNNEPVQDGPRQDEDEAAQHNEQDEASQDE